MRKPALPYENRRYRVVRDALNGGHPMDARMLPGIRNFYARVPAAVFDPEFRDYHLRLIFTEGVLFDVQVELPPQLVYNGPNLWWQTVEHCRFISMVLAALAWLGGMMLLPLVGKYRRQFGQVCLTEAVTETVMWQLSLNSVAPWHFPHWSAPLICNLTAIGISLLLFAWPRRRCNAPFCARCRYDLTGNLSGICPECGQITPAARRKIRLAELEPLSHALEETVLDLPEEEEETGLDQEDNVSWSALATAEPQF